MKFYNRTEEIADFYETLDRSKENAQMTVLIGRRRIGKTRLLLNAFAEKKYLYLFVSKKEEGLLCKEFIEEIKDKLQVPVFGEISKFKDVFALLMEISRTQNFTVIIDEFQEFANINPSIFSDMQNIWDRNKNNSKINLIISGSIYSMMEKIFKNAKEPLFGRATKIFQIKTFTPAVLQEIMSDYRKNFQAKDLLAFYIFTGGIPKYIELFVDAKALTFSKMLNEIFRPYSYFIDEGKNLLIEEFGKEYTTYFSILSLIASSKTSRAEIEGILYKNIGGYLDRLENEYSIIKKVRPVLAKPGSRKVKYYIEDNFLNFWFRYIYRNSGAVEIQNFDYLKNIVRKDFDAFSGKFLEKYFREKLAESKEYSIIGTYWEKNNTNEIDIVAVNKMKKKVLFAEVKLNKEKISLDLLKLKAEKLRSQLKSYKFEYKGYSIEDILDKNK